MSKDRIGEHGDDCATCKASRNICEPHVHIMLQDRLHCQECPKLTTPEHIIPTTCGPTDIFVFGSNTDGIHGAGAALFASKYFGAKRYIGEGLVGHSYAFPTLGSGTYYLSKRSHDSLMISVQRFAHHVTEFPMLTFWLTKVGCGLAGYSENYMRSLFIDVNAINLVKPKGW